MSAGRIRYRKLDDGLVLLILDRAPELDQAQAMDWGVGRAHLAAHDIVALRFTGTIDLDDKP